MSSIVLSNILGKAIASFFRNIVLLWDCCLSMRPYGFSLSHAGISMSLEIMQGPENITVPVEMETTLQCVVHGFPTPKVQWFKDDQMLPNTSKWELHNNGQILVFK